MVGVESFRPCVISAQIVSTLCHFGLILIVISSFFLCINLYHYGRYGERGGSVVECRTPEREVRGSRPTAAVLCP